MRILLVDSDSTSSEDIQNTLSELGHEVIPAATAADAWKRLQKKPFDIVIADWNAPKIDGAELCQQIRSQPDRDYVRIIILIPRGLPKDRDAAIRAGADYLQEKPVDTTELLMRLDQESHALPAPVDTHLPGGTDELGIASVQLGVVLMSEGIITQAELDEALHKQIGTSLRLGNILVQSGFATQEDILRARSIQLHVPFVNIAEQTLDPFVVELVPRELAHRFCILPLAVEQSPTGHPRMRLAMANPLDIEGIDLVQRITGHRVEPCLADEEALLKMLESAYENVAESSTAFLNTSLTGESRLDLPAGVDFEEEIDTTEMMRQVDQAPVIRFVNTLFSDAIRRRASDIHIEPYQKQFVIRYRIDGQLQFVRSVSRQFFASTSSRIKIMADMDIAERRLPLDGHITLKVEKRACDLRISTLPTQYGERITIRILDRTAQCLDLDQLSFTAANLAAFRRLIHKPYGIVLVTGPTGSGKTTTLYAALKALRSDGTNIITCEDPVEYRLEGISQSNVHERAGLTFARQLRAILRQDPDIILVGEIRDAETAEIAFRAALTGRLVLSTLHCNEAAGAITRLINIGLPPYLISSTLIGVVAQRLVASLCPYCRQEHDPTDTELRPFREAGIRRVSKVYEPAGCEKCGRIGTKGRVAVQEVLVSNDEIEELILERATTQAIRQAALSAGMMPMITDALEKVKQGLTTLSEVDRRVGSTLDENLFDPLLAAA